MSIILSVVLAGCENLPEDIEMIYIEGGEFFMGSYGDYAEADEKPAHTVSVKSFYLGKYEVTQETWTKIMRRNPSCFRSGGNPVESVSIDDIRRFFKRLNSMTGKKYRLPSEAEWEYAAKGGNHRDTAQYSGGADLDGISWHRENSDGKPHKVGTKVPNILGLYDMTGNVHEWCGEIYSGMNYQGDTVNRTEGGVNYVFRGGCFLSDAEHSRVSNRNYAPYSVRNFSLGFRLALDAE